MTATKRDDLDILLYMHFMKISYFIIRASLMGYREL